jgi:hypothetical protein
MGPECNIRVTNVSRSTTLPPPITGEDLLPENRTEAEDGVPNMY